MEWGISAIWSQHVSFLALFCAFRHENVPRMTEATVLICCALQGDKSIDDTSPSIDYSHQFLSQRHPDHVNGTRHFAKATGSTAHIRFFGNRVEWFGQSSPEHGIAFVHLDGDLMATVDTYTPEILVQQRLFFAYDLSSGYHDLVVTATGTRNRHSTDSWVDIDAFVVHDASTTLKARSDKQTASALEWSFVQLGSTGVAAMQIAIVSETHAIIVDKVEHNPLSISGHPAWASLYDLRTHHVRPLTMISNSFCAGGTWLSNGTLLNIGGNPVISDKTGSADFGDVNGLQAIRMFNPCDDGNCDMVEQPGRIRLASPRWYNTVTRLDDGSVMIIGGSLKGGWMNNKTTVGPSSLSIPARR